MTPLTPQLPSSIHSGHPYHSFPKTGQQRLTGDATFAPVRGRAHLRDLSQRTCLPTSTQKSQKYILLSCIILHQKSHARATKITVPRRDENGKEKGEERRTSGRIVWMSEVRMQEQVKEWEEEERVQTKERTKEARNDGKRIGRMKWQVEEEN